MKKYALIACMLLVSTNLFAVTQVKEFRSVQEYKNFIAANPNVKVIAVTPIQTTSLGTHTNTSNIQGDPSVKTSTNYLTTLVVTFENAPVQ